MIGKSNTGGGGGRPFGLIVVNYPENSTLTISPNVTVKKDLTATKRIYYVKDAGTYTLTATNGADTTTKNVSITTEGQSVSIELTYILYLIQNGIVKYGTFTPYSKGYSSSNGAEGVKPSVSPESGYLGVFSSTTSTRKGSAWASNNIKSAISQYAYLNVRCKRSASNTNCTIKIGTNIMASGYSNDGENPLDSASFSNSTDSAVVTLKIPLTSKTFNASAVSVAMWWTVPSSGASFGARIYDIWLSHD